MSELKAGNPTRLLHFESVGDLTMMGDPSRLRQAVTNLVSNAIQHGAASSPVTVSAGREGAEISVTVHNDGPPIPQDRPEGHLRAAGSRGGEPGHALVELHGGAIEAHSEGPGHGCRFLVRLPLPEA